MTSIAQNMSFLAAGLVLTLSLPLSAAQDFGGYDTRELMQLRDQNRYWDQADRDAYRQEMQGRMQGLSPEERSSMRAEAGRERAGSAGHQGAGQGRGARDGSGAGGQGRHGGSGGGRGGQGRGAGGGHR